MATMGLSMASQVASHGAQTAAARGRNNAKLRNNYIREREFQVKANLDNVQYLNDVQEQKNDQDVLYASLLDSWSDQDFQLKKLFATQDLEIEEKIAQMHQGGYSEQTGASAARATIGKDVLELGRAKTRAIHNKMMAVKETEMSKAKTKREYTDRSRKLFMDVAFAPTHGFNPVMDTSYEAGPSKGALFLGLAGSGLQGYKDFKANTADPVGG